ncbi:MAG: YjbQ family protein [Thaumarchaeota archaeon]|nr:MAG: YjbQ family protein [Nitrososphaerota archaeon]
MKTYCKVLNVETESSVDLRNITGHVRQVIDESGVKNGLVTIFVPHTTAGIYVNEDESGLRRDVDHVLSKLIPKGAGYLHDEVDDNAHAHLRSIIISPSITIPIIDGKLATGTWQSIFFAEFDGPRKRRLIVHVMGN